MSCFHQYRTSQSPRAVQPLTFKSERSYFEQEALRERKPPPRLVWRAWNSVGYCFLCPYLENFMNVHPSGITWCCQQTRTQEIEKGTLCLRGYIDHSQNVPDCLLCHSQHILNISWKSTHRFYRGVAKKNTPGAPRWETVKQSRQVWNSLANHFLCHAWRFIKISWKSVHPFFHNITNKHGSRKKINRTPRKCSRLLPVSCPSFSENFMQICSTVFLQCC